MGTGMSRVVLGSPIALIAFLSSGVIPGWARMKSSSCFTVTCVDVAVGAADFAITSCGMLISVLFEAPLGWLMLPYTSPTAGPTVTVRVAPFMLAGILGRLLPLRAAAAAACSALNVNTACACGIAA